MALRWLTNIRLNGQNVLLRTYEDYPALDYYVESDVRYAYLHIAGFTRFGNVVQEGDMIIDTNDGRNYTFELNNEDTITWTITETGRKQFFYHNGDWTRGTDYSRTVFKELAPLSICVDDENEIAFVMLTAKQYNDTSTNYYVELCSDNRPSWGSPQHRMYVGVMSEEPTPPGPTPTDPDTFTFYRHTKKINSTKLPTNGIDITGFFRAPFNLLSPVIRIEKVPDEFPYNYCRWYDESVAMFRYYWIKEKTWITTKIIECVLEEDVLATFKDEIGGTSAFVTRAADESNPYISDSTYPAQQAPDIQHSTFAPLTAVNGFYVVAFAMHDIENTPPVDSPMFAKVGGIMYYAFNSDTVNALIDWLSWGGSQGTWADYRPLDHVLSIKYIPVEVDSHSRTSSVVKIFYHQDQQGNWVYYDLPCNIYYDIPSDNRVGVVQSTAFPNHPDATSDTAYLNYAPYTELELKAGPFGRVDLSKNLLDRDDTTSIDIHIDIDLISGLSRLQIFSSGGHIIYYTEDYSCTIDIAFTQELVNKYSDILRRDVNRDLGFISAGTQVATGLASTVAGVALHSPGSSISGANMIASGISTGVATIANNKIDGYLASIPDLATKGTNGSWIKLRENWRLAWKFYRVYGHDPEHLGYPLFDKKTLNTLSGFMVCSGASFEAPKSMLVEATIINEFLNNGFYLE